MKLTVKQVTEVEVDIAKLIRELKLKLSGSSSAFIDHADGVLCVRRTDVWDMDKVMTVKISNDKEVINCYACLNFLEKHLPKLIKDKEK